MKIGISNVYQLKNFLYVSKIPVLNFLDFLSSRVLLAYGPLPCEKRVYEILYSLACIVFKSEIYILIVRSMRVETLVYDTCND